MQGNAVEHDVKRKARVVKGREEDEKEEQQNKKDDHSYFRLVFKRRSWEFNFRFYSFEFGNTIITLSSLENL